MKRILPFFIMLSMLMPAVAQHRHHRHHKKHHAEKSVQPVQRNVDYDREARWVDSVFRSLSLEQQVAQLMVLRVPINMNEKKQKAFEAVLARYQPGGVCFFAGKAEKQVAMTKSFHRAVNLPLLVCIDGEWGLGMRLSDSYSFPRQMLAGALSPKHDSLIYRMGQEIGLQCRKMGIHINFAPVVDLNSNPANPVIGTRSFGENRVRVAQKGVLYMQGMQSEGVMAVAKHFPGHGDTDVDSHLGLPVIAHSRAVVDSVDLYPFRALIGAGVGGVMVAHLQVDALDSRPNRPSSLSKPIVQDLLREQLHFNGLIITDGIDMKGVTKYYKDGDAELQALLAGNDIILLPPDVEKAISTIVAAADADTAVRAMVAEHCRRVLHAKYQAGLSHFDVDALELPSADDRQRCEELAYQIALHGVTMLNGDQWKVGDEVEVLYESPYKLPADRCQCPVVIAYQNHPAVRRAVDTLLAGKATFQGVLPVSVAGYAEGGKRVAVKPLPTPYDRLAKAGLEESYFHKIDSIALRGIEQHAYPGCQVLVAKGGKVVYNRAYGHYTYDVTSTPVDTNTIYDLASVTKVAATTFAIMKLVDAGKIALEDKLSTYLPYLKHSNKKHITVREALSHIARLVPYDNYWQEAQHRDNPKAYVIEKIVDSKLKEKNTYLYSDLGFILLGDLVEYVSGQSLDVFMQQHFYQPMGLKRMAFNPLDNGIAVEDIAPTENDKVYRHRLLQGTVHDQNADVMGGVAGHAGLFSNAEDLAQLYLMMLNGGIYKGERYLSPAVIGAFNQRYFADYGNRRALGYDKPLFVPKQGGNTAVEVSQRSYGHTGFTGTMVWVDPQYDLVYIFLSNRVYPESTTNKLVKMGIRTDIQSLIYQSLKR